MDKITKGKIPEITELDQIKPDTLLIIINALYFAGRWENIFEVRQKRPFHGNSTKEIDFLCQPIFSEKWNFTEGNEWECLGIPYQNHKAWMFIVLPKEKNGLSKIVESLDYKMFESFTKP